MKWEISIVVVLGFLADIVYINFQVRETTTSLDKIDMKLNIADIS